MTQYEETARRLGSFKAPAREEKKHVKKLSFAWKRVVNGSLKAPTLVRAVTSAGPGGNPLLRGTKAAASSTSRLTSAQRQMKADAELCLSQVGRMTVLACAELDSSLSWSRLSSYLTICHMLYKLRNRVCACARDRERSRESIERANEWRESRDRRMQKAWFHEIDLHIIVKVTLQTTNAHSLRLDAYAS